MYARLLCVSSLVSIVLSCSSVPAPQPTPTPPPTLTDAHIRNLQPGDYVRYREERTLSGTTGSTTIVGDVTNTYLADTVMDAMGNPANIVSASVVWRSPGEPGAITSLAQWYQTQDDDGTMYTHGVLDDTVQPPVRRFVTLPESGKAISFKSPLVIGSVTQTAYIEYDDGSNETGSAVAVAVENVSVPAGDFVAIRIEASSTRTAGTRVTTSASTSWVVPSIGATVRTAGTSTIQDSSTGEYLLIESVSELVETNIVL